MEVKCLFGTASNKQIAAPCFAFKANTNDTRESPTIQICRDLLTEGVRLKVYKPKISEFQIPSDLNADPCARFENDN